MEERGLSDCLLKRIKLLETLGIFYISYDILISTYSVRILKKLEDESKGDILGRL